MQFGLFDTIDTQPPPRPVRSARAPRFIPRDYQQAARDAAFELWRQHVGVIVRSPTGTGKTVTGSLVIRDWLEQGPDYAALVLAHERQLIQQFAEEIEELLGERPAIEMGGQHCTGKERIIVASRQTLKVGADADEKGSRLFKFDPSRKWLLVIDEAHRWAMKLKSCGPIIQHFDQNPDSRRLGLSATPERTDKTSLELMFPGIALDYRLFDVRGGKCAVNDGWAVPYDQRFVVVEGVDFKNLPELAKDFDTAELERILSESETLEKLCTPMLDLVGDRRTIIFNPGTHMAKQVALFLNAKHGVQVAMSLDGSYPDDERRDCYRRHQSGEFQFLSVCGLCREGYNDPGIGAVAVFRPTKSKPLAEQMKGRGCRPLRGLVNSDMTPDERRAVIAASSKPTCMVIDLVGVTGMADCASTADIMAEGFPDEVIELAKANMLAKPQDEAIEVGAELLEAEKQIAEQKAKARAEREEKLLNAKLEREARLKKQQEEMDRRSKLQADVRYQQQQVGAGAGGSVASSSSNPNAATPGQLRYLSVLGARGDWSHLTKKQAGRMIDQIKNKGMAPAEAARVTTAPKPAGPAPFKPFVDVNQLLLEAMYADKN